VRASEKVVRHIVKRRRDWVGMLRLGSGGEGLHSSSVARPDEMYGDRVRSDVRCFLRRLDDKRLCVVAVGDEAMTAYLINLEKYVKKYGVRRWRAIEDGRGISA
jgi:hypothetical protein